MLLPICGYLKNKTNKYNKTETDSQIYLIKKWLPVGRKMGEGQETGRGLGGTSYYV